MGNSRNPGRDLLLDISRQIWRAWRGGVATGIDRVCQAYAEHFGARSLAVVQWGSFYFVLSPDDTDRLLGHLLSGRFSRRRQLAKLLFAALWRSFGRKPRKGALYLNVGHTGLNEPSLPAWIARYHLRAIYLIHDLIPITHPQFCRAGESQKHSERMRNVLASACGVIGNSEATIAALGAFAAEIGRPMPAALAALISGGVLTRQEPRSVTKPYFVAVGTIEGRKNHQILIEVWRKLVADLGSDAPELVIVGQRGWQAKAVLQQLDNLGELDGHVREVGRCGDAELASIIVGARALLMPSFVEGFGLPIIEALELGTPVIASNLPVYREIAGDIPTYLSSGDRLSWETTIRSFMGSDAERERQMRQMREYRAPTWKKHFAEVNAWLSKL